MKTEFTKCGLLVEEAQLVMAKSTDGKNWTFQTCTFDQLFESVWHLDVEWNPVDNNYCLITYAGEDVIRYYKSDDGINWEHVKQILALEEGTFYNTKLYRASPIYNGEHWLLYFTAEKDDRVATIGLMMGKTLESLEVIDGGYTLDTAVFRDGIRFDNTGNIESLITLADTGECIGFDYETKTLYFQRSDGTRVVIAR